MKLGLLTTTSLTTSLGLTLLSTSSANAALFFGPGTSEPTNSFSDDQDIPETVSGLLTGGQLVIEDINFDPGFTSITGALSSLTSGGAASFLIEAEGDFILDLSDPAFGFIGQDRSDLWTLDLLIGSGYDFEFSSYSLDLETTEGEEANDLIEIEFASGDKATVTFSYDADAELQPANLSPFEVGGEFVDLNHVSGLIETSDGEIIAFGNEGSIQINEEGSRRSRARNVPSSSDVDFDLTIGPDGDACPVADDSDQVVGIGPGCSDENGLIVQDGSFIEVNEEDPAMNTRLEVSDENPVVEASGVTTGLQPGVTPPEPIPGPSAVWGIATVSAMMLRRKLRQSS